MLESWDRPLGHVSSTRATSLSHRARAGAREERARRRSVLRSELEDGHKDRGASAAGLALFKHASGGRVASVCGQ